MAAVTPLPSASLGLPDSLPGIATGDEAQRSYEPFKPEPDVESMADRRPSVDTSDGIGEIGGLSPTGEDKSANLHGDQSPDAPAEIRVGQFWQISPRSQSIRGRNRIMVVSKTDANETTLLFVNSVSKDKKNKVKVRNSYLIPPNRDADNLQEYNNLERSEPSNPNWVRISRDAPAHLPPARVLQRPVTDKSRAAPKTTPSSVDSSSNKMVQFGGLPPVPSNRASDSHMVEVVEMPAGSLPKPYLNAPDEPPTPDDSSTSFPPSDPRFRPPATGIQHYQDPEGRVHVVLAADLDASTLSSAYAAVIVETAAEATALATAAANQRHDNRRSSGRLETLVVPTSLRTRKDQDTAIVLIGDLKAAEQQAIEYLREANIKKEQLEERLEEALEENCHLERSRSNSL